MELYFRAKSIFTNEWLYGDQSLFRSIVNPSTIGIWTGLVDRNGTRVFDGDTLKWCNLRTGELIGKLHVVRYGIFNCSCCEGVYGWYLDYGDIRCIDNNVVVGSILDNPDLVKEV